MKVLRKFFPRQSVAVTAARTNELILFEMILVFFSILMTKILSFTLIKHYQLFLQHLSRLR